MGIELVRFLFSLRGGGGEGRGGGGEGVLWWVMLHPLGCGQHLDRLPRDEVGPIVYLTEGAWQTHKRYMRRSREGNEDAGSPQNPHIFLGKPRAADARHVAQ